MYLTNSSQESEKGSASSLSSGDSLASDRATVVFHPAEIVRHQTADWRSVQVETIQIIVLAHELLRLAGKRQRAGPAERGGLAQWQQKRVVEFMEEHLVADVSLAELADLVRLSPYHFVRSFKQSFGQPPHRYWSARRIERAKELLANPNTSITAIALEIGFSGSSAFSSTFHRIAGQTPSAYRRSLE
jgi:AraC family transcriptional regulator